MLEEKIIELEKEFEASSQDNSIIGRLVKGIIVLLATCGPITFVLESYNVAANMAIILLIPVNVYVIGIALHTFIKHKGVRIVSGVIILQLLVLLLDVNKIIKGIKLLYAHVRDYVRLFGIGFLKKGNPESITDSNGLILDADGAIIAVYSLTVLVAVFFYITTSKVIHIYLQQLVVIPIYISALLVGARPGLSIIVMVAYYILAMVSSKGDMKPKKNEGDAISLYCERSTEKLIGQIGAVVGILVALSGMVLMLIMPASGLGLGNSLRRLRKDFGIMVDNISINELARWFDIEIKTEGSMRQVDELGAFDKVSLTNKLMFEITVPRELKGNIYIRSDAKFGYVSTVDSNAPYSKWDNQIYDYESFVNNIYRDKSAQQDINSLYGKSSIFARNALFQYNAMKLAAEKNKDLLVADIGLKLTNGTINSLGGYYSNIGDSLINEDLLYMNYTNSFQLITSLMPINGTASKLIGQEYLKTKEGSKYKKDMESYEAFVRDNYMTVPQGLTRFHEEFGELSFDSVNQCVKYVKDYLNKYTYTFEPGATPMYKDFVEYFLFENKKGYCVYFASAATLMFREFGIPARYVEGFMLDTTEYIEKSTEARCTIPVIEKTGHAWVEIYIDDFGWLPIEVTPEGYRPYNNIPDKDIWDEGDVDDLEDESSSEETTIEETTTEETTTEQITEPATEETTTDEAVSEEDTTLESLERPQSKTKNISLIKGIIKLIRVFLVLLIVPVVMFAIALRRRNKMTKLIRALGSNNSTRCYKALKEITENTSRCVKASIKHYTPREDNVEVLAAAIENYILGRKGKRLTPKDIRALDTYSKHKESCSQIFAVLDECAYAEKTPERADIIRGVVLITDINRDVYNSKGPVGKWFIKYFKCLYLSEK